MEIQDRFLSLPKQSFFLLGPRGTGKSTWLRQSVPDALFVDLLQPDLYRDLKARPERLDELILGSPDREVVVLDEVQRVPEVLNVVHSHLARRRHAKFILTGSSARKLRRGGIDLLAGRAILRTLHPFMAAELPAFRLDEALRLGLMPLVRAAESPEDTLRAYATLYLEQEVQFEGWTRDMGAFARFLEVVSFSHGAVLNVANVARECQLEQRTVAGYVRVLEDLLLAFRVQVFTKRARRETSAHPKLYLFDAGVYRSLRPSGPIDRPEQIEGAALEGLVAQHLRAWIAYHDRSADLYFWRTRSGVEVDFVVYGEAGFWAIEVKNTARARPEDLSALKAFATDYRSCEPVFLYRGRDRLKIDGVWCIPVESFLSELRPGRGLTAGLRR